MRSSGSGTLQRPAAAQPCSREPAPGWASVGSRMAGERALPSKAGPVPDRLTIWPVDDGRYGLDASFKGETGFERAERHRLELEREGVRHTFRQEPDGAWTLRFGPLRASEVARALSAFVY